MNKQQVDDLLDSDPIALRDLFLELQTTVAEMASDLAAAEGARTPGVQSDGVTTLTSGNSGAEGTTTEVAVTGTTPLDDTATMIADLLQHASPSGNPNSIHRRAVHVLESQAEKNATLIKERDETQRETQVYKDQRDAAEKAFNNSRSRADAAESKLALAEKTIQALPHGPGCYSHVISGNRTCDCEKADYDTAKEALK